MKGLLLKEWYMVRYYGKLYLLTAVAFTVLSLIGNGNMLFVFYPCLLCGMIPMSQLGYDEKSGFLRYGAAIPCSKAQVVSAKYLLGLFSIIAVLLLTGTAQAIKMAVKGEFMPKDFAVLMLSVLLISLLSSSIPLPFIFRYGVEKGRIAYYLMIGFVCSAGILFSDLLEDVDASNASSALIFAGLATAAVLLYGLSWFLSVRVYRKREF